MFKVKLGNTPIRGAKDLVFNGRKFSTDYHAFQTVIGDVIEKHVYGI